MKITTGRNAIKADRQPSLSDAVYDQILELIIRDIIPQGTVITERNLVEKLDSSKAPVREALLRLCTEGALTSIPRYGYMVNTLTEEEIASALELRIYLEQDALRRSFETIRQFHLQELDECLADDWQSDDIWGLWDDNRKFHLLLASYADNMIINHFLDESMKIGLRVFTKGVWNRNRNLFRQVDRGPHRRIVDAVRNGDLELALTLLREDILAG